MLKFPLLAFMCLSAGSTFAQLKHYVSVDHLAYALVPKLPNFKADT
jgi:hypothetical protein